MELSRCEMGLALLGSTSFQDRDLEEVKIAGSTTSNARGFLVDTSPSPDSYNSGMGWAWVNTDASNRRSVSPLTLFLRLFFGGGGGLLSVVAVRFFRLYVFRIGVIEVRKSFTVTGVGEAGAGSKIAQLGSSFAG